MDVFSIGAGQAPKAPDSGNVDQYGPLSRGDRSAKAGQPVEDSFASSDSARRVQTLVERLVAGADENGRTDLVAKFRALMEVGDLDSFESAEKAAESLLGGPSDQA